ncbi:hypothetical protein SUDANB95_07866 (plasmid) [Actinosynnema sp. ALI-1.44]
MPEHVPGQAAGQLPELSAPIIVARHRPLAMWRSHGRTHAAPVLSSGLIAWSQAHPVPTDLPPDLRRIAARLAAPGLLDRAFGSAPIRPETLPRPGRPLLVHHASGVAYWLHGPTTRHCPWFDDGLLGWGYQNEVDSEDVTAEERTVAAAATRTLRDADPALPHVLVPYPAGYFAPRELVLTEHDITPLPATEGVRLLLRIPDSVPQHGTGHTVWLTRDTAEALAAQVAAYPGMQPLPHPDGVPVQHAVPHSRRPGRTTWRINQHLAIQHDPLSAPRHVAVQLARPAYPLVPQSAHLLAGALLAAVDRIDRVAALIDQVLYRAHLEETQALEEAEFARRAMYGARTATA